MILVTKHDGQSINIETMESSHEGSGPGAEGDLYVVLPGARVFKLFGMSTEKFQTACRGYSNGHVFINCEWERS